MEKNTELNAKTRELLIKHYKRYPKLKLEDILKYIFQSAFGYEHLVLNEATALNYIKCEYGALSDPKLFETEALDGGYSRICLSCIDSGLAPETLAKLFCLSSKKEEGGKEALEQKIKIARRLVEGGELPFNVSEFDKSVGEWQKSGYPAIHHSDDFREAYHPAYRVIANRFADFLPVFSKIDTLLRKGSLVVAIEGGSASGKTTLADILSQVYDCNVFHMDDFFLRPEQRTPERFSEVGGNVDRERFFEEILQPLKNNETVHFRRFDCRLQTLSEPISVVPNKLTIIEGAYSMHPSFGEYSEYSVFLDIDPEYQRKRILVRNSPQFAERFFSEWIPLENKYFEQMNVISRCSEIIKIKDSDS